MLNVEEKDQEALDTIRDSVQHLVFFFFFFIVYCLGSILYRRVEVWIDAFKRTYSASKRKTAENSKKKKY